MYSSTPYILKRLVITGFIKRQWLTHLIKSLHGLQTSNQSDNNILKQRAVTIDRVLIKVTQAHFNHTPKHAQLIYLCQLLLCVTFGPQAKEIIAILEGWNACIGTAGSFVYNMKRTQQCHGLYGSTTTTTIHKTLIVKSISLYCPSFLKLEETHHSTKIPDRRKKMK